MVVHKVITYRLSCGACNIPNVRYVGTTEKDLKDVVPRHTNELWETIRWEQVVGNAEADAGGNPNASEFGHSALGRHIIDEHCKDCKSKREVSAWWKENLVIRIKTHKYEKRPETDGTFNFLHKDKKPEFVQQQQQKEQNWEDEKKKSEEQYQQKLFEASALQNEDCFDVIWMQRYEELKTYAGENDGDTNVPREYAPSPLLGKWVENQRLGYRRKHNIRPKLELEATGKVALSDEKEFLLKDIGFAWFSVVKQRWDDQGIAVMYGHGGMK